LATHHFSLPQIEKAYELFGPRRDEVQEIAITPLSRGCVSAEQGYLYEASQTGGPDTGDWRCGPRRAGEHRDGAIGWRDALST
jgi:hypothetical protein